MKRRGITVTECLLALTVVVAAVALLAQFLSLAASQRRGDEQCRLALAEVANRLEQASILRWDELTGERLEKGPLPAPVQLALRDAKLTAQVTDEPGPARCRRIRVALSWTNAAGIPREPVVLVGWRFRDQEAAP
jgi:hypothetical protein